MWQFICKKAYPALRPAVSLTNLKKLRIHGSYLATEEYAFLEEVLPGVDGATWGPYRMFAYRDLKLPSTDIRAHLPDEVIRENILRSGSTTTGNDTSTILIRCGSNSPARQPDESNVTHRRLT